ncbi:MAG: hypothetical protein H7318_09440 [Oligoflexus sp.]|nr:hypothetical protein [Oligoflexus sp.]
MTKSTDTRREQELSKLDIDRRKTMSRRDDSRRQFIDDAYSKIYIPSYVNLIYPQFPVNVHAFSNDIEELSPAEWAVNNLGLEHAKAKKALMGLKEFAKVLVERGLVTNADGESVSMKDADLEVTNIYYLNTGT